MTIHFSPDLETNILAAVHNGRYASLDDAMTEAAHYPDSPDDERGSPTIGRPSA